MDENSKSKMEQWKDVNTSPNYVRQQKGHSIMKHVLFGWIALWIPAIYYTISPNHYWHF